MASRYSKKPVVTRFNRKKTYSGRDVKRTKVVRRNMATVFREKKGRPMRPIRKGA